MNVCLVVWKNYGQGKASAGLCINFRCIYFSRTWRFAPFYFKNCHCPPPLFAPFLNSCFLPAVAAAGLYCAVLQLLLTALAAPSLPFCAFVILSSGLQLLRLAWIVLFCSCCLRDCPLLAFLVFLFGLATCLFFFGATAKLG